MTVDLPTRCRALLAELGLIEADAQISVTPLSGGVASDIAKVTVGGAGDADQNSYCVKFALAKLRVKADWFAPVTRNFAEYQWLKTAAQISPDTAIRLYGHSARHNGFVMSYLAGDETCLFKSELLAGNGYAEQAEAVGRLLGQIHAVSAAPDFDRSAFDNRDDFYALRIEPYLVYTAQFYPEFEAAITEVAEQLYQSETLLIHGDVSPKNILFQGNRPYLLDAECATMGDSSFDVSFCLNHFILKAVHVPECLARYLSFCRRFWAAYRVFVNWEEPAGLEARILRLLPILMLARVDGKSPVEYLTEDQHAHIRQLALQLLEAPAASLDDFIQRIERHTP